MSQAARRARHIRLGVFILGAVFIALIFVIAFGAGFWFRPRVTMETYFDESVQGIDVGSPLKFRGVTVGEVSHIGFTYTQYEQDKPAVQRRRYVLIEASLRPRELTGQLGTIDRKLINAWIQRGLRVRMAAQGLTGTYYLELDYVDPQRNPPLPIDWTPDNLYIPSTRSAVTQIVSGAEALMRKLERANIDELFVNLNGLMLTINQTLQALQTERMGTQVVELLGEVRETNRKLQSVVANPAWQTLPKDAAATLSSARRLLENPELPRTIDRLGKTIEDFDRAAGRLDRALVGPERDLPMILDNLRQTTENMRDLTATLRRSPSTAIFGEVPRPLPRSSQPRR
ncbi:MAG TPA: MlaD family protein [Burkholderiales bacterium]|nr:MlaD family protein [Burkholderiales bacterium]